MCAFPKLKITRIFANFLQTTWSKKEGTGLSMDKGGTSYITLVDDDFPGDITVLHAEAEVVKDPKNPTRATLAEGIYNHHNVLLDFSRAQPTNYACEGGRRATPLPVQVLVAGAGEKMPWTFYNRNGNPKTGYYLSKNRVLMNMVDIVNYKDYTQEVFTATEIEYIPGKAPGFLDTELSLLEPGLCGGTTGIMIRPVSKLWPGYISLVLD